MSYPATMPCLAHEGENCRWCDGSGRVVSGRTMAIVELIRLHGPKRAAELVHEADAQRDANETQAQRRSTP